MSQRRKRSGRPNPNRPPATTSRPRGRVWLAAALVLSVAAVVIVWRARRAADERPYNVLLVTIDTLRWDHLGCYGDRQADTPAIDALAQRGVRFQTAVAHVPLTAPSHASILTGLTPLRHGVRDNGAYALPSSVPTVATRFRQAGYRTAAVVSGFPLDHRFGFASGFDEYDDRLAQDAGRAAFTESPADRTTDRALAWLAGEDGESGAATGDQRHPWFLWVHYFDPHAPYAPPRPFAERFLDHPYDGEIAFVDAELGRLLRRLESRPDGGRTIVLVTADHGESFGEHGEETHGVFVYDATLRVPFIVAGPGVRSGTVSSVVARGVDVLPTLLDLAGIGVPGDLDGRSLRPSIEGGTQPDEPTYIESLLASRHLGWAPLQGIRTSEWKYIRAPKPELYDLTGDASEQRNRIEEGRPRASALEAKLEQATRGAQTPAAEATTSARDMTQLRALGYLSGGAAPTTAASGKDPKDGIALITTLERGVAQVGTDPAGAIATLEAVLQQDSDATLAHRYLAFAYVALGRHDAAIRELAWLQQRGAATADDLLLLSESHRALGHAAEARALVDRAEALAPKSPEAPLTGARAAMAEGRVADAEAAYQRALALAPDHPEALRGLGETALARGDLPGASSYFERARARDPGDGETTLKLAVTYARGGQMDRALPLFEEAVRRLPANGDALAGLAAALARSGRAAEAVPYFQRAVDAGLRTPAVLNGLGFARLEAGDLAGALSALRASLQLRADQPQVQQAVQRLSQGSAPQ